MKHGFMPRGFRDWALCLTRLKLDFLFESRAFLFAFDGIIVYIDVVKEKEEKSWQNSI